MGGMYIDQETGLLQNARIDLSPNFDYRPENSAIDLLVIHSISLPPDQFGGDFINKLFKNQLDSSEHPYFAEIADMKVSAHLLIQRDGVVTQFVPFHRRAWHAGLSQFKGRNQCNDFSIGIELEGTERVPYTAQQYERLLDCTRALMVAYPKIQADRIVGHSDIAPGRKTDPGPTFDWTYYLNTIHVA